MRRTHLKTHAKILKRLLIHVAGFNLALVMRTLFGFGTPRGLQDLVSKMIFTILRLIHVAEQLNRSIRSRLANIGPQ